jgi:hypothetical protein
MQLGAAVSTAVEADTAAGDTAKIFRTERRHENGCEVFTTRSHFPFEAFIGAIGANRC